MAGKRDLFYPALDRLKDALVAKTELHQNRSALKELAVTADSCLQSPHVAPTGCLQTMRNVPGIAWQLQQKSPVLFRGRAFLFEDGLAVTYFRVRMHTIIGANPFHGPVRDGKVWAQAAMAARLTLGSLRRQISLLLRKPRFGMK